jgi:hypothetical protein
MKTFLLGHILGQKTSRSDCIYRQNCSMGQFKEVTESKRHLITWTNTKIL